MTFADRALAQYAAGGVTTASSGTTTATGAGAIAIGGGTGQTATANGRDAIAIGSGSSALGNSVTTAGIAIGWSAVAGAAAQGSTLAIGTRATATTPTGLGDQVAIGTDTRATGQDSIAFGAQTTASGTNTIAIGNGGTTAGGNDAVTVGVYSTASGNGATILGNNITAGAFTNVTAVGLGARLGGNNATAVGAGANAAAAGATAIGSNATAPSNAAAVNSVAIGGQSSVTAAGTAGIAIGLGATVSGANGIAAGNNAVASGANAISIGNGNRVSGANSVAIGDPTTITGANTFSLGNNNGTIAASNAGVFGNNNVFAAGTAADGSRLVGNGNNVSSQNVMVLGNGVTVASGLNGAVVLGNASTAAASVPTPTGVINGTTYTYAGGAPAAGGVVSVGSAAAPRQIQNVAAGRVLANSTDAINGSQLFATNQAISAVAATANAGWNITTAATGTGTVSGTSATANVAPGATVRMTAGNNIAIARTGANLTIATNPNLVSDSLTINGGPTINGAGITMAAGDTLNMGGNQITNVANGTAGGDAVNLSQLTQQNAALTAAGLNFTDASGTNIVHKDLGGRLPIIGAQTQVATGLSSATATAGSYSSGNIQTFADAATGQVQIQFADAPKFGNVTINDAGSGTITGVTAGTLSATSTEAVNGSQVFALGNSTAGALGGSSSFNPATGVVTAGLTVGTTTYTNVQDALTQINGTASAGWNVTTAATGSGTVSGTSTTNVAPGGTATFTAGNNIAITQNGSEVQVAVNPNLTGLTSVVVTGGPTIDNSGITMAAGNTLNMGGNQITNVANGTADTDAVNVSQLNSAIGNVNLVFTGNAGGAITRSTGQTLAIQGVGSTAGGYSGNNVRTTTDPASGAVNIEIAEAPKFGNVTINDAGSGTITGLTAGTLSATSTEAVNGSQVFAIGTSMASVLGGASSFDPATGSVAANLTVGGTTYTNVQDALVAVNGMASAGWNVTTGATGSGTASGTSVTQVAPGGTATFTAGDNIAITQNGAEVQVAVNPNLTGLDSVAVTGGPTVNSNGIAMSAGDTLDMGGGAITNVAPGVNQRDAVNVGQLDLGLSNTLNSANSYTDARVAALSFDLSRVKRDSNGGTASAMAMSQIPQAFEPGMGIVGMGMSTWQGQQGFAIGVSKASDNGRVVVKAAATYNTRGQGGAAAGVGFQF